MTDNERARIRQIMYEPSSVWLATENSGDRWLTDQFVLYNVTDADVVTDLADGPYQLMATGAWRAEPRNSIPEPDIEAYFGIMASSAWLPATPTEWSVAEHPGKAMLWVAGDAWPCLVGESTWTAIKRHHPDALVAWAANEGAGTFRFSQIPAEHWEGCFREEDIACGHRPMPFAYAAGIRIPLGQEDIAEVMSVALDRTSNKEVA